MTERRRHTGHAPNPGRGRAVDLSVGAVVDPTENVRDLVIAANTRQDDLRTITKELVEAKFEHLQAMAQLRAEHVKELASMESSRLNAIRQVDVLAVSTAADQAQAAIQTLAASTTTNAENIRNALTATATAIATQTANTVNAITERLAALEKSSYEGKGKQTLADPMLVELVAEMKSLRQVTTTNAGKGSGMNAMWGYVVQAIGLLAALGIGLHFGK